MKLLVVHLSDVHFRVGCDNVVTYRASALATAAHNSMPDADNALFVVSGDIAHAGKPEEYALAATFLQEVITTYRARNSAVPEPSVVLVPGNHDCKLDEDQTARDTILNNLQRADIDKPSVFSAIAHPQRHFFEFAESGLESPVKYPERVAATHRCQFGDAALDILCLNTALCTRLNERPGTLHLAPLSSGGSLLTAAPPSLTLIVAHHPPHWLTPESYHDLRALVIDRQAFLLTGHEHQPMLWAAGSEGRLSQLIEGGVLQDFASKENSSFHTLAVDTTVHEIRHTSYRWDKTIYVGSGSTLVAWAQSTMPSTAVKLTLKESHHAFLEDLEHVITHPRREHLKLSDVFVLPDLRSRPDAFSKSKERSIVKASHVFDALLSTQLSLIQGRPRAGKTSLAKRCFYHLWTGGSLPLFVRGDRLRSTSVTKLRSAIEAAIVNNYKVNHADEYLNAGHRLVLIIDDLSSNSFSPKDQDIVLGFLRTMFSNIIVFDRRSFELEDLVRGGSTLATLKDITQYDLISLGNAACGAIIERWVLLGTTPAEDEGELHAEVVETTKLVDLLLGRDLVPRTPFYVLSLLSALRDARQPTADLGSLGYLYDLLVRTSLAKAAKSPELMSTLDQFLADLAHSMYTSGRTWLTRDDFAARCDEYASRYLIEFDRRTSEQILTQALILRFEADHVIFRYHYLYYFFVAKYFSQRLSSPEVQSEVRRLSTQMDRSAQSNILAFMCHCTSDPLIVESVVKSADDRFAGSPEVDLERDTLFLNELAKEPPSLTLGPNDPQTNRRTLLATQDSDDERSRLQDSSENNSDVQRVNLETEPAPGETRVSAFNREIAAAFKTVEVVGQILRNHPTIDGVNKVRLVKACTSMMRRMMSSLLSEMSESAPSFIAEVQKALIAKKPTLDPGTARMMASQILEVSVEAITIGMLESYADDLGIANLSLVFRRVKAEVPDGTMRVFGWAVQLQNPRRFPETETDDVFKIYAENTFMRGCIRALVFIYYYYYGSVDRDQRQRVCGKFGINVPQLVASDYKRNA